MKLFFFSLLTFLLFTTAANAQVEAIVMNSTTLDKQAKSTTSKTYIHEQKVLIESTGQHSSTMLFDAEEETFYIIDHKKKEYTQMTRQDIESLSAMLGEQMKMLEQQLAALPEAQREAVRKQMNIPFEQQQEVKYQKETSGSTVKGWKTDKFVGMADGQKKSEIYLATYEALGQDKEDFEALEKFLSMMQEFARGMAQHLPNAGLAFLGEQMPDFQGGIPVKTILYNEQGEAISTSTINSIEEEEAEESLFSIPEDYKQKEITQSFMD